MKRSLKIVLVIVAACLVTGGTAFGAVVWATWGEFDYEQTFYYTPGVPSPIESLDINSDIGAIIIQYNATPTDNYAKIDLDIKVKGGFVAGKSFLNFFEPVVWQNESGPIVIFDLNAKSITSFFLALSRSVDIYVTLRSDVVYNIDAFTSTGSIELNASSNKIINNTKLATSTGSVLLTSTLHTSFQGTVDLSTSTGSIRAYAVMTNFSHGLTAHGDTGSLTLSFTSCIISDNLIGTVSTGSITITSYNTEYTKDCTWDFETATGSIDISITQFEKMNANISGSIEADTGTIDVVYNDSLASVGAEFTCSVGTGTITYTDLGAGGMSKVGNIISTDDYNSASDKYTLSLTSSTGNIEVRGQSL